MQGSKDSIFGMRQDFAVFAGVAASYVIMAALIGHALGSFPPDPDYAYLLNGLDIVAFKLPLFVDHPGTPVQTIVAIVLGIAWFLTLPWHGLTNVQDEVLAHPQFYMECVNSVFVVGITGALVFFVWSVRKASGMFTPALVGLASIFTSYAVYMSFHRITPEPALFGTTLVLAGLIAQAAFARTDYIATSRFAMTVGALLGFCITAKVTSAPLLLTLFLLRSKQAKKNALVALSVSVLICLLPVLSRAPNILQNYTHIFFHKGDYGVGKAGAPSLSEMSGNLSNLYGVVPGMFLYPALYALVLLGQRILARPLPYNFARTLLLCLGTVCAAFVLEAKQSRALYMLSSAPYICLANTILAFLLFSNPRFPVWARACTVSLFAVWAFRNEYRYAQVDSVEINSNDPVLRLAYQRGCLTVFYYGVNHPQFDLFFGNTYAGHTFDDRLTRIYPKFINYMTNTREFRTFDSTLGQDAVAKLFSQQKCVDFLGMKWDKNYGISPTSLHPVAHSAGGIVLYALQPAWDKY